MAVQSHAQLVNGLMTNFTNTYTGINNRQSNAALSMICDRTGFTMNNRKKNVGYRKSAPHFRLWERHDRIKREGMGSVLHEVEAFKWGVKLDWLRDDREDDQTGTLVTDAQNAGASAALHDERMFFDAVEGTTTVLPYALTAPDGSSFFNSGTRFETSGGNIESGTTLTTAAGWQAAVYAARKRFMDFKDGKGQPLLMPEIVDGPMVVVCSSADAQYAHQLLFQERNLGTSGTVQTSNLMKDTNKNVTLWDTSRLSTGNAYVFLTGGPVPPTYVANRTPLETTSSIGPNSGSDETAEFDQEWVQWRFRKGFGLNEPYCAIKLTA